jgi:hypothetical protein
VAVVGMDGRWEHEIEHSLCTTISAVDESIYIFESKYLFFFVHGFAASTDANLTQLTEEKCCSWSATIS